MRRRVSEVVIIPLADGDPNQYEMYGKARGARHIRSEAVHKTCLRI